jgi:hypothetical protein
MTSGAGGGGGRHFFKYSLTEGYFKRPISLNLFVKLAPTLLQCQSLPISFPRAVRRENFPKVISYHYKAFQ